MEETTPEVSLLDVVISLIEAWKPILFGAVACGLAVFAYMSTRSPLYEATVIAPLSGQARAAAASNALLDGVGKAVGKQRKDVLRAFEVSKELQPGSGLYSIKAKARSDAEAQQLLQAMIATIAMASKPFGPVRDEMLVRISLLENNIADLRRVAKRLGESIAGSGDLQDADDTARAYAVMLSDITGKEERLATIKTQLDGFRVSDAQWQSSDVIERGPTLGSVMAAVLVGAFFGFVFWVVRKAMKSPRPEHHRKVARLRAVFGFPEVRA